MKNDNRQWEGSEAKWISMAGCAGEANLYLDFARRFELKEACEVKIRITAVSQYVLWVNGKYIDRGPAVGYQKRYYYDELVVDSDALTAGQNLIAVCMYHDGRDTETIQGFEYGEPGLLAEVLTRGGNSLVVSDGSWKVRKSPVYSGQSMVSKWGTYKEFYHGDKEDGWRELDFDHGGWADAVEVAEPVSEDFIENLVLNDLDRLEISYIRPERIVSASANLGKISIDHNELPFDYEGQKVKVGSGEDGSTPCVTYDFGAMRVGYPEIEVGGGFCIYEVWYGESLDLYRLDVVRKPLDGKWKAFQRRAFRYLMIKFIALQGEAEIEKVGIENVWYAYDDSGLARCSDERVNEILEVSKYTLRINTSYHYEDCPWREQALWIFDMRVMAMINYYFFGNPEIVAKNIRQCFALQNADGSLNSTGPKKNTCYHLDFCMHLVSAVREYYNYSGDVDTVRDLIAYIERLEAFILSFKDENDILDSGPVGKYGAPFLDWSSEIDKLGKSVILNAVFARYLGDLEAVYEICGKSGGRLGELRESNRQAVNGLLYDEGRGLYRDSYFEGRASENYSMQGNMAAVYGGFVGDDQIAGLLERISDESEFPPPYAPSFYLIIFDALARAGRPDEIMAHIKRYWGAMLERGAKTWWEVFDPDSAGWSYPHPFLGNVPTYEMDWIPVSTCHGWSGAAAVALPRYILGVDLMGLADNKIEVRPRFEEFFEKFTYRLPVKGGMLELEFDREKADKVQVLHKPEQISVEIL